MVVEFKHVGWIGLAPILIADLETECPVLHPRVPLTGWLIEASAWIYEMLGADGYPLRITGELDPPIRRRFD